MKNLIHGTKYFVYLSVYLTGGSSLGFVAFFYFNVNVQHACSPYKVEGCEQSIENREKSPTDISDCVDGEVEKQGEHQIVKNNLHHEAFFRHYNRSIPFLLHQILQSDVCKNGEGVHQGVGKDGCADILSAVIEIAEYESHGRVQEKMSVKMDKREQQ